MAKPAVNIAVRAARAAARELIRMQNRNAQLSVAEKEKHDFVTEADTAAEKAIIYEIRKAYPDHAILAEESGAQGESDYTWIIDPLDGTTNIIYDLPHYAISNALTYRGRCEHGVIYDPVRDEMFTASRGDGAYLNDRRIRVGQRRGLDGAILATAFPFRQRQRMQSYQAMFDRLIDKAADVRRAGSAALDLAYVATGRVDGYWEMGLAPWDLAAGTLLVEEAGGSCFDFTGGRDYMKSGDIIAGSVRLAPSIQKEVAAALRSS